MRALIALVLPLLGLALLTACAEQEVDRPGDPAALEFAPQLGVDLDEMERTGSGLYLQDIEVGEGTEVADGRTAVVHYVGAFPDGRPFDSSREREEPFSVRVGAGAVIAGWDEGLQGMRPGGRRLLVIPPELGYGPEGRPPVIPPNQTLVFDVEVLDVR